MTAEKKPEEQRKDDLEQLQQLLLGEERSRLKKLDERVSDFESRANDVAEVLPAAFQRVAGDPVLEAEIERPVLRTIRESIKRDAHAFAEYLFPVMGPAIRRAVADALKSLVQRINVAMENSFSVKGIRWRIEAARTGEPFAQILLRHTMLYAVQEAFLIARETGLVLAHTHRDENLVLDEDAVAAMLSAIQSFIQDSLGMSADDPLRSAELGDRTLWVINGPDALLACIIEGTPPRPVRDELMALLETIHARFGDRFGVTDGSLSKNPGMRVLIHQALREELDDKVRAGKGSKAPIFWAVALALLVILLGWWIWHGHQQRTLETQVVGLFREQPGYVVSASGIEDGVLVIDGLRDPGSSMPAEVLSANGIPVEDLLFRFKLFWSLEPALVIQRLRSSLQLTDATSLELDGGTLMVSGALSGAQTDALDGLASAHPLIDAVDLSNARMTAEEAVRLVRAQLGAPPSVNLKPVADRIEVSGISDISWYLEHSATPRSVDGWAVDFGPMLAGLQERLLTEAAQLSESAFYFTRQDRLTADSASAVDDFASDLQDLMRSTSPLGMDLAINLIGEVDGTGTAEQNQRVSRKRVEAVRNRLTGAGIDASRIRAEYPPWSRGSENLAQRRVTVRVERVGDG